MTFQEILEHYQVPYITEGHHHAREGWIQFDCPFCGEGSGKWHMGYNPESHAVNCWRCGTHKVFPVLSAVTGITGKELYSLLDHRRSTTHIERQTGRLQIPDGVEPMTMIHKNYLRSRNFDPDEVERLWKIQGFTIHPQYSWRLFIPVELGGEIQTWTTRTLGERGTRYISAPKTDENKPLKSLLYGEDYARHAIIICEGPADVWRIGPGAVATFGVNNTLVQLQHMKKFPVRVVCFDRDAGKRAKALVRELSMFDGETYLAEIDAKDPAEASEKEIQKLRSYLK